MIDAIKKATDSAFRAAGFSIYETGGSCSAWGRETGAGQTILVTGQDGCSHEPDGGESYLVGIHEHVGGDTYGECNPGADPVDAIGAALSLERLHAPRAAPGPADLYNCQPDYAAPDWARFTSLELSGVCLNRQPDGSTECEARQLASVADIFTVYGIGPDGMADAITDCYTGRAALAIAAKLATLSRLPLYLDGTLSL